MNLISYIPMSIITFILLLLCFILINERKRNRIVFLGIMFLFNIYSIFVLINSFRRDYNHDLSTFPLNLNIAMLILINLTFIISRVVIVRKKVQFEDNGIEIKIQVFFYSLRDKIFLYEKKSDSINSIFLLFCLICGISFVHTSWHELSHAISAILNGGYFGRIELDFYTYGTTYEIGGVSFNNTQYFIIYLSGLLGEIPVGIFLLSILRLKLKKRSKFNDLLYILVFLIFIVGGFGYFSIPVIFTLLSDSLFISQVLNIPPIIIFLASFPFFLVSLILAYKLLVNFYREYFKPKRRFFYILTISCLIFITFFTVSLLIDFYFFSFPPIFIIK